MLTVNTIPDLRRAIRAIRAEGLPVAFVPTMGNLHRGHIRLVEEAKGQADRVVVSIFVNPTQFGPTEDYARYPRTPEADAEKLRAAGTDLLYLPGTAELYPVDPAAMAYVEVPGLSDDLCGRFRPGHFRGVATVVLKLFNQVQPDLALFGEKDFQQLTIIRRMAGDLDLPVRILGVPTVRESDGLAMSSRNAYLSADERTKATALHANLSAAAEEIRAGARDFGRIAGERTAALQAAGFRPDYFAVRRQDDLTPPGPDDRRLVILVAARLGSTRLIDNVLVNL